MTMYPTPQQAPQTTQIAPTAHKEDQSIGELLSTLTQDLIMLVKQELTLAKTEMSQKIAHVTKHLGILVAGGAVAYAGVIILLIGLAYLLDTILHHQWLSFLIIGAAAAGGGGFFVMKALAAIRKEDLKPHQTIESFKKP